MDVACAGDADALWMPPPSFSGEEADGEQPPQSKHALRLPRLPPRGLQDQLPSARQPPAGGQGAAAAQVTDCPGAAAQQRPTAQCMRVLCYAGPRCRFRPVARETLCAQGCWHRCGGGRAARLRPRQHLRTLARTLTAQHSPLRSARRPGRARPSGCAGKALAGLPGQRSDLPGRAMVDELRPLALQSPP